MIGADPEIAIAAIWERLADEHGTTVAYPTCGARLLDLVRSSMSAGTIPE
jgi:hypothetical protein